MGNYENYGFPRPGFRCDQFHLTQRPTHVPWPTLIVSRAIPVRFRLGNYGKPTSATFPVYLSTRQRGSNLVEDVFMSLAGALGSPPQQRYHCILPRGRTRKELSINILERHIGPFRNARRQKGRKKQALYDGQAASEEVR